MSPDDRDRRLVSVLEDYHRRRALGEGVSPSDYQERLGDLYDEFATLVEAGDAIDRAKTSSAEMTLPRPFGPYLLERVLGGGGMGIVYEAFHRELARRVAVKVLPRSLETNATNVERFKREARSCAQVRHPNVVVVHEAGEVDGHLYYAMELVEGKSLQTHIDERTAPEPLALFAAMADVADALEALHHAGVVHRDVKPGNLIVRPDGRMVLADFGLARTFTAPGLTQTGEALGTPPYMSPEQLLGRVRDVDARTDVYGLGATIYHALTGAPPFAARETQDLVRMVLVQRPDPLRRRRPDLSADMEAVVAKALEKRKEDRYTTAGDLRDDLRRVVAGEQPVGRPVPPWLEWLRAARRPLIAAAAAAAVIAVAGGWWWTHRSGGFRITLAVGQPVVVLVDGTPRGTTGNGETAVIDDVSPGEHIVALRLGGFETDPTTFTLAPGRTSSLRQADFSTPAAKRMELAAIDVITAREGLEKLVIDWAQAERTMRSAMDGIKEPLAFLPRGTVRREDAGLFEVAVPAIFDDSAQDARRYVVVVRDRNEEPLGAPIPLTHAPGAAVWSVTLPPEVIAAFVPGSVISWRVQPSRRPTVNDLPAPWATFTVSEDDPSASLQRVDKHLFVEEPRLRSLVRARVLLAHDLTTAAARELLAGWTRDGTPLDARSFYEWATLDEALSKAGGLGETAIGSQARAAVESKRVDPQFSSRFVEAR